MLRETEKPYDGRGKDAAHQNFTTMLNQALPHGDDVESSCTPGDKVLRISKTMGSRPAARGIGLVAVGVLALTACTPTVPGESDDADAPSGDSSTFTLLLAEAVDSLDPALAFSTGGRQVTWLMYEALVRVDPETGDAVPGLAESWEFTPASASFVIKEGATCADGSEITAGTVARNFERWKDPETNAPLVNNFFGSTDFAVAYDDEARTVDVQMTTAQPFLGTEPSFTTLGITCDSALEDPAALASASDGTGPYVLAEYVNGSHVTLQRRDDYAWGPEGFDIEELPATLQIDLVVDPNTQVNLLLGGDADAALLGVEQLPRIEAAEGFSTQVSDTSVTMMMFNERDGLPGAEEAVRLALAQALDFQEIADVQTQGMAYTATFLRPPHEICVSEDAIADVFPSGGIEAAQATLEGAGFAKNADGIYERDGEPLSIQFLGMDFTSATAELVTAAWAEVGVDVAYDDRAQAQAVDVLYAGAGWDVAFVGMGAAQPTGFRPFFVGPPAPEGPNFGAIENPAYAQLQAQASEVGGMESCPLWIEAEAAVVDRVDWVPAMAVDSSWVIGEGASFWNDGAYIDPLTLRKN